MLTKFCLKLQNIVKIEFFLKLNKKKCNLVLNKENLNKEHMNKLSSKIKKFIIKPVS
jgi:hypothetical protein